MRSSVESVIVLAIVLTSSACGPSGACIDRTRQLETRLSWIPKGGRDMMSRGIGWQYVNMLVVLDDAVAAADDSEPDLVLVRVQPAGVSTQDGEMIASSTVAEAKVGLGERLELERLRGRDGGFIVLAHHDTHWSQIVTVLEATRALGHTQVDVLFMRERELPAAPESSLGTQLQELSREASDARAVALSQIAERLAAPCPPIGALFDRIPELEPDRREATLTAGIGDALRTCDCKADVEAVGSLFHHLFAPDFVPAVVRLKLAPADTAVEPLTFDRDATWADVHGTVVGFRDRPMAYATQQAG